MSNLKNTLLGILLVIFFISLMVNTSKTAVRLHALNREQESRKKELETIISQNEEIREKLITLDNEALEALVRDKLSMAKPGETVVILPEEISRLEDEVRREAKSGPAPVQPHWQQWLEVFGFNYAQKS